MRVQTPCQVVHRLTREVVHRYMESGSIPTAHRPTGHTRMRIRV